MSATSTIYLYLCRESCRLEGPGVVEMMLLHLGLHLGTISTRGVRTGVLSPVHHAHTPRDLANPERTYA